jgi:hypothetical protein
MSGKGCFKLTLATALNVMKTGVNEKFIGLKAFVHFVDTFGIHDVLELELRQKDDVVATVIGWYARNMRLNIEYSTTCALVQYICKMMANVIDFNKEVRVYVAGMPKSTKN